MGLSSLRFASASRHLGRRRASLVFPLCLLISACQWPWGGEAVSTDITLAGSVEAREIDLAFQVPGRIAALLADEGDTLSAGQAVARLDPRDYELNVARGRAEAEVAKAALTLLEAGARPQELRVAEAAVSQAEAQLRFARAELRRVESLVSKKLAAQEQLDQLLLQEDVARAALAQAQQQLALLRAGARKEAIAQARAQHEAALQTVAVAQQQLTYIELGSPANGVVTVRLAEAGEVVGAGQPVLRLAETARPWVRAYLNETDLPRVKLGQAAELRVDGLPGRVFKGRVVFISPEAEFTPKTVETRALRVDLVYRIKVEVDNADGALKIGMPADVIITPSSS